VTVLQQFSDKFVQTNKHVRIAFAESQRKENLSVSSN